jgi:hypothetical protein
VKSDSPLPVGISGSLSGVWPTTIRPQDRLSLLPAAQEHILALEDGKARLLRAVTELTKAFALSVSHEIARELVETVRRNATIDWTLRENVRAQLRVFVKRILRKYGYPPDKQEQATCTVLEQAEVLSGGWVAA